MKYYIYYNGGKIYYSDSGEGKTIILLHGYLESSEIWDGFAEKLASNFRVICIDLPGHGRSTVYSDCHSMEFMAKAVKGFIDTMNLRDIFLAGHSLGGYVTLAFLELFPEMLNSYCLFHSQPFADTAETIQKREREIQIVRSGKKFLMYPGNVSMMYAPQNLDRMKDAVQRSKDIAAGLSDEGIIAVLNGMIIRPSRLSVMEKGIVPCLWILGKTDCYIPCEAMQKRVKLPSNAKLVVLQNSGHLGFIEEEILSVKTVSDFVSGII
jgi:pimeloyl-ACP methyl ester carboxylesterase